MQQTDAQVKPDVDGEERILQIEAVLELEIKIYKEEEHTLLQDVYTPLISTVFRSGSRRYLKAFS